MTAIKRWLALVSVVSIWPLMATAAVPLTQFEELVARCAPEIHPRTFKGVVHTESTFNPFAIGVVGGKVARTPRNQAEAVATAKALEKNGFNFSMGLAQVNRYNLVKYGETYDTIFEPCRNIKAGAAILKDCYVRARGRMPDDQKALRAAFSCYYSGNFTRGFKPDRPGEPSYVQKVVANALGASKAAMIPAVQAQGSDAAAAIAVRADDELPAAKTPKAAQGGDWVSFGDGPLADSTEGPALPPAVVQRVGKESAAPVQQTKSADVPGEAFVIIVD